MAVQHVRLIVNPNGDLGRAWQARADLRPVVEQCGGADWSGAVFLTHPIFYRQPRSVDMGRLVDGHNRMEYWDNTVCIGFDATVTIWSRRSTWMRGFIIYLLAVIQTIILGHDLPHIQTTTDRESCCAGSHGNSGPASGVNPTWLFSSYRN
ncbi:MAG: hypothetical protein MUE67_11825 [Anaerolineales bacterium]|jgi:hypothetical protein|nr:hypothetical protein [Anaerolineales bacterium]